MHTCEPPLIVLALVGVIGLDMPRMILAQPVDGRLDHGHAARLPHRLSGEIAVGPGAVPVAHHGLRVHGDDNAELLGDSVMRQLKTLPLFQRSLSIK